jgi:hypothetical protein
VRALPYLKSIHPTGKSGGCLDGKSVNEHRKSRVDHRAKFTGRRAVDTILRDIQAETGDGSRANGIHYGAFRSSDND